MRYVYYILYKYSELLTLFSGLKNNRLNSEKRNLYIPSKRVQFSFFLFFRKLDSNEVTIMNCSGEGAENYSKYHLHIITGIHNLISIYTWTFSWISLDYLIIKLFPVSCWQIFIDILEPTNLLFVMFRITFLLSCTTCNVVIINK